MTTKQLKTGAPASATRRSFLKTSAAVGGGLTIGFNLPAFGQGDKPAAEVNAWVQVRADDTVIIKYARAEMGQGSMTSAPQLVADELDLHDAVHDADLVVTGEGYLDEQSFEGKVIGGVQAMCEAVGTPVAARRERRSSRTTSRVVSSTRASPLAASGTPVTNTVGVSPCSQPMARSIDCSTVPWGTISPPILENRERRPSI